MDFTRGINNNYTLLLIGQVAIFYINNKYEKSSILLRIKLVERQSRQDRSITIIYASGNQPVKSYQTGHGVVKICLSFAQFSKHVETNSELLSVDDPHHPIPLENSSRWLTYGFT